MKELGFLLGQGLEERVQLRKHHKEKEALSLWGLGEGRGKRVLVSTKQAK